MSTVNAKHVAVVGAGNWGTALSLTLANLGHSVKLWAYEKEVVESIHTRRENELYMPGVRLPAGVSATSDLAEALRGADILLTVMPSHVCRTLYEQMPPHLRREMIIVSATKGLDTERAIQVVQSLRDLVREQGRAGIMVTHDMRAAAKARLK